MRRALLVLLATVAGATCARVMAPPGWVPDRTPPQLVSTTPAQLAVVPDFKGAVAFRFDKRISEQGINDELAVISPDTGLPIVKRHGRVIEVRPRTGWKPGHVYQVVLLPGVKDLFGNARKEPVQLVFSTGPAIPSTVVAGLLTDRITGQVASDALIQATSRDSLTYTTASDSVGFFALRFLPEGTYRVRAFVDKNKNRHPDYREAQGEVTAILAPQRDTLLVSQMALLPGDTTPARVLRAEVRDSLQVRVTLDDYVDAARPLGGVTGFLWRLPDSAAVPVRGVYLPVEYDSLQRAARPDTSAAGRARAATADTAKRLPTQDLVVVPGQPLAPRTRYRVTLQGITNISDVRGGGGSTTFQTAAPAPVDTTRGRPGVPRDTTRARAPAPRTVPGRPAVPPPPRDTTRTLTPHPIPRDSSGGGPPGARASTRR